MLKSITVGPIEWYKANNLYFLLKVKNNLYNKDTILSRPARLLKIWEERNIVTFQYKDNTQTALPKESDQILAVITSDFFGSLGKRDVVDVLNTPYLQVVKCFNRLADFRVSTRLFLPYDGTPMGCIQISDFIKGGPSIIIPEYPRFKNKEILEYTSDFGKETIYSIVDNVTTYLITLPSEKLEVPSYRLRLSPVDNTNPDDPNKVITVVDRVEVAGNPTSYLISPMRKLPQNVQDDLRRNRFDPFYRYGGL